MSSTTSTSASAAAADPASQLPIDIHYDKLLDWLVDRKWVAKDAGKRLLATAARRTAVLDSVRVATQRPAVPHPTYYNCKALLDELAKNEQYGAKSVFGQYSLPFMKDLSALVKELEASNLYLADSAAILVHDVDFEVPALRKKLERAVARVQDAARRETELNAAINSYKASYREMCQSYGIQGQNVAAELRLRQNALQDVWANVVDQLQSKDFRAALQHYADFVAFNAGKPAAALCPTLSHLMSNGDTSVHTFTTGEATDVDNGMVGDAAAPVGSASGPAPTIDFGDAPTIDFGGDAPTIDFGGGDAPTIDFGGDAPTIDFGGDAPTIDFGGGDAPTIDFGGDAPTIDFGDAPTIDFGGDAPTIDFGGDAPTIDFGDGAASTSAPATRRQVIKESVLQHTRTRNLVLDELDELAAFLRRRLKDLKAEADILSINLLQEAPASIQSITSTEAELHEAAVKAVQSILTSDKTRQLVLLKTSPRYFQRIVDSFQQHLNLTEKATHRIAGFQEQQEQARQEAAESGPQLELLRKSIKELQRQVEQSISALYSGRIVHLIGDINASG